MYYTSKFPLIFEEKEAYYSKFGKIVLYQSDDKHICNTYHLHLNL